jgi:hypothetical protein|tara:strand:+ start:8485 stop:9096 length:612 start_codon:yes stop_codon:yes gene_type:complete
MIRLLTYWLFFGLLISLGCQSKKKPIKSNSQFEREQNSFFKDATTSPLKAKDLKAFQGLRFFPIDSSFIVKAQLFRTPDSPYFEMKTTTDLVLKERVYGILYFSINKQSFELNLYQSQSATDSDLDSEELFLPFLDDTNGVTTYGGGRYIDLAIPVGNQLVIDFNQAYNPYCAYNEKYSCPIVPKENYLPLHITAGVKRFKEY